MTAFRHFWHNSEMPMVASSKRIKAVNLHDLKPSECWLQSFANSRLTQKHTLFNQLGWIALLKMVLWKSRMGPLPTLPKSYSIVPAYQYNTGQQQSSMWFTYTIAVCIQPQNPSLELTTPQLEVSEIVLISRLCKAYGPPMNQVGYT